MKKVNTTAVIIHGTGGNPNENWFPWLADSLRELNVQSIIPTLPTPENQNLTSWEEAFKHQVGEVTDNMILVGHSLGVCFILDLLDQTTTPITATFLVSGFLGKLGINEFDLLNHSFVCRDFNWSEIKRNAGKIYMYNSDNDPYVPLNKGRELATLLDADLTIIPNGGHINASAGYTSFPQLLADIKKLL